LKEAKVSPDGTDKHVAAAADSKSAPALIRVRYESLFAQVVHQIRELITSGAWAVGAKLPSEHDLRSQFAISRNTLREALRSLAHAGFIEARVGDGTYVRSPNELRAPFIRRAGRSTLRDAMEMREALEKQAAYYAAIRRSEAEAEQLGDLIEQLKDAAERRDRLRYIEVDAALHALIVKAARSDLVAEIYEYLGDVCKPSVNPDLWDEGLAKDEVKYHSALVAAIRKERPSAAERAANNFMQILMGSLISADGRTQ
jgi:DNA-binding FadR family transcriptional regulator